MIKEYLRINETVFSQTLPNGLQVVIIPKPGYQKTFTIFTTKYGALHNRFTPFGETEFLDAPLGIAHFLEHKLFAMPGGTDASDRFAVLGLESNAMTKYTTTSYLFEGTKNLEAGLELLLDFVQKPSFTKAGVQKEQGIIEQELKMYLDSPSDVLQLGLMNRLFSRYPLIYDIGGTVDSIKKITPELLKTCHSTFYHPSNMILTIVGDIKNLTGGKSDDPMALFDFVSENQSHKRFSKPEPIQIDLNFEDATVKETTGSAFMDLTIPKTAIGLKLPYELFPKNESMIMELALKILLEAIFGPSTDAYQEMLDQELIQGGFSYESYHDGFAGFIRIQTNTRKPEAFISFITEKLLSLAAFEIDEETFARFKKAVLGNFIKSLNSFEFLALGYLEYGLRNSDIFETLEEFDKLTRSGLKKYQKYFVKSAIANFTVFPKNSQQ